MVAHKESSKVVNIGVKMGVTMGVNMGVNIDVNMVVDLKHGSTQMFKLILT